MSPCLCVCVCVSVYLCVCLQTDLRWILLHDSIWPLNPFEMMSASMKLTHSFKLLIGDLIALMRKKRSWLPDWEVWGVQPVACSSSSNGSLWLLLVSLPLAIFQTHLLLKNAEIVLLSYFVHTLLMTNNTLHFLGLPHNTIQFEFCQFNDFECEDAAVANV